MFKMVSEYGNEIAYAPDERKRDSLLELGFKVVEEPQMTEELETPGQSDEPDKSEIKPEIPQKKVKGVGKRGKRNEEDADRS